MQRKKHTRCGKFKYSQITKHSINLINTFPNSPAKSTMPTSVTRVTVASAASRPILPWVTPEKKKQGPLTHADEKPLTVSEKRLTRAVTEEENKQEVEFDKEMFTFRTFRVLDDDACMGSSDHCLQGSLAEAMLHPSACIGPW
jgi:hypothetical protein